MTLPTTLPELLAQLRELSPIERARVAGMLVDQPSLAAIGAVRREAVYDATRTASYAEVAAALGVSQAAVNKAITEHRRATRPPDPQQ